MNSITGANSWRLIYRESDSQVIAILQTGGTTSTTNAIAEFTTEQDLTQFVQDNNLKLPPLQNLKDEQ